MADMAVDGHYLKFATMCESEDVFFEDYESDSFQKSKTCVPRMIKNNGNMFLVVDGNSLKFEDRKRKQFGNADCLFQISCYRDSEASTGSAVTLTVSDKGQTRFICSRDDGNVKGVYAKLQKGLPDNIDESGHEAIFILEIMKDRKNTYRIRSSLWSKWFLTFKEMKAGVVKLVLRKAGDDWDDGTDGLQLI